jgi:hypothetical protein
VSGANVLSQHRVNEIWWAGYCDDIVARMATTDLVHDGHVRIQMVSEHVTGCTDGCRYAVLMKMQEAKVAASYGEEGVRFFTDGHDVTRLPSSVDRIERAVAEALERVADVDDFLQWILRVDYRHGTNFPLDRR